MEDNFYASKRISITKLEMAEKQDVLARKLHSLYKVVQQCYIERRYDKFERNPRLVPEGFEDRIRDMNKRLYCAGIEFYRYISEPVFCDHSSVTRKITPIDLLMMILARMAVVAEQPTMDQLESLKPYDFEYARKNKLVRSKKPFLSMDVKDLMNSIKQLAHHWLTLQYNEELVHYLDMVEYRCFMLLCETYPSSVHNLVQYAREMPVLADVTEAVSRDKEKQLIKLYSFSDTLLNEVSTRIFNFRIRVGWWSYCSHIPCPKEYEPSEEDEGAVHSWLEYQAKNVYGDKIGTDYRKQYYRRQLRPGELEEYRRLAPHDVMIDQRMIQRVRGDTELKELQSRANREEYVAFLQDPESQFPTSCPTMAHLLLSSFFEGTFSETPWSRYCIFYEELDYRFSELSYVRDPIIVQTFNFFHVYFRGEIYVLHSYVKSVACWLNIVDRLLQGLVEEGELSVIPFFASIFGKQHPRVANLIRLCHLRVGTRPSPTEEAAAAAAAAEAEAATQQQEATAAAAAAVGIGGFHSQDRVRDAQRFQVKM